MSLLGTLSLPFGDSETAVVPGHRGSGQPPSPVPEQHAGGRCVWGRGENMAHFYIQIDVLECYFLQKSRVLCQLHFNQIYNNVILSVVIRTNCFTLMHLQRDFILKIYGENNCDLF